MAKPLLARLAGAFAVICLALLFVAAIPFLGATSSGANLKAPPISVNRALKGDRLPMSFAAVVHKEFDAVQLSRHHASRTAMPVGCDPAFSPVTNPVMARYFGRCMT